MIVDIPHFAGGAMMEIISIDVEIMGGTPCFHGSRVPVAALFYNLADGLSLDEIFDAYPTIPRNTVMTALSQGQFPVDALQGYVGDEELTLWKTLANREGAKIR
jgi:uncharacterized protein (DUF433 family)